MNRKKLAKKLINKLKFELLKEDLESERQRADELSDTLDRLHDGTHEDSRIIPHDEYKDFERMGETLNALIDLQDDIREDMNDKSNRGEISDYARNKIREFIDMELN